LLSLSGWASSILLGSPTSLSFLTAQREIPSEFSRPRQTHVAGAAGSRAGKVEKRKYPAQLYLPGVQGGLLSGQVQGTHCCRNDAKSLARGGQHLFYKVCEIT